MEPGGVAGSGSASLGGDHEVAPCSAQPPPAPGSGSRPPEGVPLAQWDY